MLAHEYVVEHVSEAATARVVRECMNRLRQVRPETVTPPGVCDLWEELCVQLQGEKSLIWDLYLQKAEDVMSKALEILAPVERVAIWLGTANGSCWAAECVEVESVNDVPVDDGDLVELVSSLVQAEASSFSNQRIRRFRGFR